MKRIMDFSDVPPSFCSVIRCYYTSLIKRITQQEWYKDKRFQLKNLFSYTERKDTRLYISELDHANGEHREKRSRGQKWKIRTDRSARFSVYGFMSLLGNIRSRGFKGHVVPYEKVEVRCDLTCASNAAAFLYT